MKFKDIRNLIPQWKEKDIRLYQALVAINDYLVGLSGPEVIVGTSPNNQPTYFLNTVPTDLAGINLTLDRAGEYLIFGKVSTTFDVASSEVFAQLVLGDTTSDPDVLRAALATGTPTDGLGATLTGVWHHTNTVKTSAKLQAWSTNLSAAQIRPKETKILAVYLGKS